MKQITIDLTQNEVKVRPNPRRTRWGVGVERDGGLAQRAVMQCKRSGCHFQAKGESEYCSLVCRDVDAVAPPPTSLQQSKSLDKSSIVENTAPVSSPGAP